VFPIEQLLPLVSDDLSLCFCQRRTKIWSFNNLFIDLIIEGSTFANTVNDVQAVEARGKKDGVFLGDLRLAGEIEIVQPMQ
jgi:hypothetical protein